jgi:transposase
VAQAYALAQRFTALARARHPAGLAAWLAAAQQGPPEIRRFAHGIVRDRAAVEAALCLPWSQGQVEGQVNRAKLIKRLMFGRGSFALLRRRVLYSAAPRPQRSRRPAAARSRCRASQQAAA